MSAISKLLKLFRKVPWWVIVCFGIVSAATISLCLNPDSLSTLNFLRRGIRVTLFIATVAYLASFFLGIGIALVRISPHRICRELATLYVELVRGLPVLIVLYFLAFVLIPGFVIFHNQLLNPLIIRNVWPTLHIQNISMTLRAIIALSITYSAFMSEIFRSGIQSVDRGQYEAAKVLGLNHRQILVHIILPQTIRYVSPSLINEFIALVKSSSLVSILGVPDITQLGKLRSASTFKFFETYSIVAFIYLGLTLILSGFSKLLEKKLHRHRRH